MPDTHLPAIPEDEKIDASEEFGTSNPDPRRPIGEIIEARYGRRALLGAGAAAAALAALPGEAEAQGVPRTGGPSTLGFEELRHGLAQTESVAEGYEVQTLIRWGDPILADAPDFTPGRTTPDQQARQFGYNNDYLDFFPLPAGSNNSEHGLLAVNHEYTNTNLMWPGMGTGRTSALRASAEQARTELLAHGMSVVEIRKTGGRWSYVKESRLNRRITGETPMRVAGPAAGHDAMKTSADPTGLRVLGTLNNCAGGNTPWGTVLTAEENFNGYFGGAEIANQQNPQHAAWRRYGLAQQSWYSWPTHMDRFDVGKEPNEPNRFGWVVEFDPYDPQSEPVKRTALGRFKHEGCHHAVNKDGRVVIYMGDDERFEFVYRFVTARPFDRQNRAANRDLLDEGVLSVAKLHDDGKLEWLDLVHGQGPLTEANGFRSQADVVINARQAASLLGATPMDRPEDVEPNKVTGRVYVMLTNNDRRTAQQVNAANPRARNTHGHVVEIVPPGAGTNEVDHAAKEMRWGLFLVAGKPGIDAGTQYHRATGEGWLSCPDNCAFDSKGRIWIATDGAPTAAGIADGLYAADTRGAGRALTKLFYQAPTGAEVCGPLFTPDDRTVFLAIQHPGEDSGSSFERPSTRWPDFAEGVPPRPSVIAIVKKDGGVIGD
ncbi:PhoX family phosphatase [Roseomonas sp. PWR1]|uniref:PhoX family phosphatase n=1 Tax=Roseomonas nitratireducens TaxID=2820810 RepID=A0ABS4AXM4_9PROT|nr:PhoX family phosphatase [Neoroseomonas nitratireducens]MBP0466141.1 PhoX family phosphatase [Neoroseomonas nitratireducens]